MCHLVLACTICKSDVEKANLYVGVLLVLYAHDDAILCPGCHLQIIRAALLLYDQTVVARCLKRVVQALHTA